MSTIIKRTRNSKKIVLFDDDTENIRNIAFEKITDNYSWGEYVD